MPSEAAPSPVTSEHLSLAGSAVVVRVRAAERLLAAGVESGDVRKAAPLLPDGADQTARIDLSSLPAGDYDVAARSAAAPHIPLGQGSARIYASQGGGARKVSQSNFRRPDGTTAWAALYVTPRGDVVRLRIADADDIEAHLAALTEAHAATSRPLRFSVISPVYNVEKYLDAFFESLVGQTLPFKNHIELVMVDDGSTDRSPRIIERWRKKYPKNIVYLRKENGGISTARNAGLAAISHDWFTFIDPDDFVSPDFFARADETIRRHGAERVAAVSQNVVHYMETTGAESDGHPLRYRFQRGERAVTAAAPGSDIQITVCGAFWRRDIVAANNLAFDPRIRPGSEDAHFVGRYLMRAGDRNIVFQPAGRYFHRRRADQSSLSQTGWTRPESYDDELRFGYLDLIADARRQTGSVPRHIQTMLLYCLSWAFRRAVEQPDAVAFLTAEQRQTYAGLLRETLAAIDAETIAEFGATLTVGQRAGLLGLFKQADLPMPVAEVTDTDDAGLIRLSHWSRSLHPVDTYAVDGQTVEPAFAKARRIDFLGELLVYEHIRWVPARSGERLSVSLSGKIARIDVGARRYTDGVRIADIRPALTPPPPPDARQTQVVRDLRRVAFAPAPTAVFQNAWLFIDRDTQADDSAEFLYRHVRANAPDINAFFILSRQSPHWPRLEADGFRLIGFNEPDHAVALLHADHLISSQADHYVADYLSRADFGDLLKFRFTFLQHGVTQADFSDFFNRARPDLVTSSTRGEHDAFVANGGPYRLTDKEVRLTGLARHDALLDGPATDDRTIVVMPTWRANLTGRALGAGNARTENPAFYESEFARRWKSLLHAPRLASLDHRIVFMAHPNLEQYLPYFDFPSHIEVQTFGTGSSMQPLFRGMSVFVTDFSSKAFDAAYLHKPVVYYQFDRETYFGGGHTGRPGYFDFKRDGFGPVAEDEADALSAIEEAARSGGTAAQAYRQRAESAFAYRDGKASERILTAIRAL